MLKTWYIAKSRYSRSTYYSSIRVEFDVQGWHQPCLVHESVPGSNSTERKPFLPIHFVRVAQIHRWARCHIRANQSQLLSKWYVQSTRSRKTDVETPGTVKRIQRSKILYISTNFSGRKEVALISIWLSSEATQHSE